MNNQRVKNILILASALIAIMLISTSVVIGFNSIVGLNTDVNNDDVATAIAAVAFGIAVALKFYYDKKEEN